MRDGGADREARREPGTESDLVAQVVDYAIFALAPDGTISSWNAGAERLKGYRASEILGRSFRVLYPPEDRAAGLPDRLLAQAASEGRVEHEGWRQRRDGSRFWGDVVITARRDDTGRLTGFTKVTRDLTGRKQVEAAQDAFYAAFEHDFRAPVAAVRGAVDALRHDDVSRERRDELLDRVEANADRLLAMAGALVEYARTRSGESPVTLERLAPDEVARATLTGLEAADAARVRVVGRSGDVEADRGALQRVVANLVTNALRYSPVDSAVEVRCGPGPLGFARIEVVDRGRGIAPEDLPQIFEAFERGRLADGDGTGMGLASVQALVARNGGRVDISSVLGEGTTVTVDLPLFPG